MHENTQIRCSKTYAHRGIDVHIFCGGAVAKPLEMEEAPEGLYIAPVTTLGRNEAQQLMDDLWVAGVRPTEGAGSAGSLKATQDHLEDMKRIAFHGLKIAT